MGFSEDTKYINLILVNWSPYHLTEIRTEVPVSLNKRDGRSGIIEE